MIDQTKKVELQKGLKTATLLWLAIFISLLVYIAICHFLGESIRSESNADLLKTLKMILPIAAAIEIFLSIFMRKKMLSGGTNIVQTEMADTPLTKTNSAVITKYTTIVVLTSAISESVGIFGMVLYLLGDSFTSLYQFMAIAAIALLYHRPRMPELEEFANSNEK